MAENERPVLGGRYELYRRIARGGTAEVFLARDQLLDRPVAVKVLFPEFATDESFVERFRREAQAAANLTHPNIVGVYDWGQEFGTYYIVMEYIEGRSLAEIIRSEGPLHPDRAADIAIDIAAALSFAHRGGVVHRDVKPGNVLITGAGQVKVTDFGIARAITGQADEPLTQVGMVMGTATYLSPEQAQGIPADPRSDVYSLSVVLYEMLTAGPPFTGETPVAIAYKHVQEPAVAPSRYNADVPVALEAITMRGLTKDRDQRYASAEDFRADLRRFRTGEPVLAMGAVIPPSTAESGGVGIAGAAAAGAVAGAVVAGAAGLAGDRSDVEGDQAISGSPAAAAGAASASQAVPAPAGADATVAVPQVPVPPAPSGPASADYYGEEPPARTGLFVGLLIFLLIVLAVLVFFLIQALNSGDGNTSGADDELASELLLPDLEGLRWEAAEIQLAERGFTDVVTEFVENDEVDDGIVFDQDPPANEAVNPRARVTLMASTGAGLVQVPNVIGDTVAIAGPKLMSAGFEVSEERVNRDDIDVDIVFAQSIPSTESVPKGTTIVLSVSAGPDVVQIPVAIVGLDVNEARLELARLGLTDVVVLEETTEFAEGTVLRTDPAAGTDVPKGSEVTLFVAEGPNQVIIPTLAQIGSNDPIVVAQALIDLGLTPVEEPIELAEGDSRIGLVVDLVPTPGTVVVPGDQVIMQIGTPPPSTTTSSTSSTTTTSSSTSSTTSSTTTSTTAADS